MILNLSNVDVYREIGIRFIFPIVCVEKLRKRSSKIGREQIFYGLNLSTLMNSFKVTTLKYLGPQETVLKFSLTSSRIGFISFTGLLKALMYTSFLISADVYHWAIFHFLRCCAMAWLANIYSIEIFWKKIHIYQCSKKRFESPAKS